MLNLPNSATGETQKREHWHWDVWFQPQYDLIHLQQNQAILMRDVPSFPNMSAGEASKSEPPTLRFPQFSLRIEPYISPDRYKRLKAENKVVAGQMEEMQKKMTRMNHKSDSYFPENEADKKQVEAYRHLKGKYHFDLPDFYFRDISLSWFGPPYPWTGAYEEKAWKTIIEDKDEDEEDGRVGKVLSRRNGAEQAMISAIQATLKILTPYDP